MKTESQIFISHAKKDKHVVIRILKMLDDAGIKKWVDIEQIDHIDSRINERINDGLSASNYFLLIWSKNAAMSSYVRKEYNAAISDDYDTRLKKIIIKLDNTRLPPLLADIRYHNVNDVTVEKIIENIIKQIKVNKITKKQNQFNSFLDVSYGKIKIVDYEYSTSVAFKKVDPKRYQEEFEDWIQNE